MAQYKRILLKLSGESLAGGNRAGIDAGALTGYAGEIRALVEQGVEVAVVLGGGNIFRGIQGMSKGFDRVQGDQMGMLATIINSMALQSALEAAGIKAQVLSGIPVETICEKISRRRALQLLDEGYVVLIAGGTGNPFFTTDSAAALRALEVKAEVILKGTRVDGVYSDDPEKNPNATRYDVITFDEAIQQNLKVMDITAFTLCKENALPIIVFNVNEKGVLYDIVVAGKQRGSLIK
ncbi:MAG: UMP kinase [Bacteroidales bacterium]|nr:UMP kinase [Bacteroidales bacterium]